MSSIPGDPVALPAVLVVIGSSAGGIEPAIGLISRLQKTGDCSVLLAQHLSPTKPSILPELIQRRTRLRCKSIEHWDAIEADTVYIAPPGQDVVYEEGRLLLMTGPRRITPQPSIDQLYTSLAVSGFGPRTIAVALSGLGADGSQGLRTLKKAGALTLAQRPTEAGSPDMPDAALATGCVDLCGSVEQLAVAVQSSIARLARPPPPPSRADLDRVISASAADDGSIPLERFSDETLGQAAVLRMTLVGAPDLSSYASILSLDPSENAALLWQILQPIGSFDQTRPGRARLLSRLVEQYLDWPGPEPFRVWCVGCASGEEAYAMAFALETARQQKHRPGDFLIYATDLLPEAVSLARAGVYSAQELEGLPQADIGRYFGRRLRHFQVNLDLRRKLIFSVHDAIEDAPWPALNFISCLGVLPCLRPGHAERLRSKLAAAVLRGGLVMTD